ncbi:head-tail connector protein [Aminobacter sp. AP02]|uniref:head-tail connector protein n=1 Tax=Aminobacter sp. AP02 TaxID=2135737 RepID=UPI000D6DB8F5|nr:head-tail connector protein [Aminobacter sp. AP02]PWK65865.1 putative phage protein (predicted DNA packaging) [Aminobacter sp. AP02]
MALTLEKAKKHLRIEFDDDNEMIQLYLDAAKSWALRYCNRLTVPAEAEFAFDAATLLTMADLYENREAQTANALHENVSARRLIDPYRLLRV